MSVVHPYRIRHKLTGLYYSPKSNSNLSEEGKIYKTNSNLISYLGSYWSIDLRIYNKKLIEKYREVLSKCGTISEDESTWNHWQARGNEFEREDLTLNGVTAMN